MSEDEPRDEDAVSERRNQDVKTADAMKILHENCRQNIEFAKNQQWRITNYALLVYAALFGAVIIYSRTGSLTTPLMARTAVVIGMVVALFGLYLLYKLQKSQQKHRKILTAVEANFFPREFRMASSQLRVHYDSQLRANYESFWYHGEVYVFLSVVIFIGLLIFNGLLITVWLLAR